MTDSEIYELMHKELAYLRESYRAARDRKDPNTDFALGEVNGFQAAMNTFYRVTIERGEKRPLD